jgi:hypothetical protein
MNGASIREKNCMEGCFETAYRRGLRKYAVMRQLILIIKTNEMHYFSTFLNFSTLLRTTSLADSQHN